VNRELTRCGVDFNFLDAISIAAFVVAVENTASIQSR
jgi:hypothetical protein